MIADRAVHHRFTTISGHFAGVTLLKRSRIGLAFIDCKSTAYGGQHALTERCAYLERKGVQYTVLHPFLESGLVRLFRKKGITQRLATLPARFLKGRIGGILRIQLFLVVNKPQIIHADAFDAAYIACLLKKLRLISSKIVFTIRSDRYHFFNRVDRVMLRQADVLITNSEYSKSHIRKFVVDSPVLVHYSPIDFADLLRNMPPPATRVGRLAISYVGALEPRKNFAFFVEMASHILKTRKDVVFHVFGDAKSEESQQYLASVMQQISDADREFIVFKGYCPISKAISETDILLCPYLREPLGRVVPEFLYAGKPVVVSDSGGLIEAGVGWALSYESNSVASCTAALAAAMERMQVPVDLPAIRSALEKRYSPTACVELDHKVYESLRKGREDGN